MATYVILSKLSPLAFEDPKEFRKLADTLASRIRKECKGFTWKQSFATLGRFDVVDIVESKDPDQVARAALIICGYGHASTETLPATEWNEFLDNFNHMESALRAPFAFNPRHAVNDPRATAPPSVLDESRSRQSPESARPMPRRRL
jgi:uncharacterized protein with GYD domain